MRRKAPLTLVGEIRHIDPAGGLRQDAVWEISAQPSIHTRVISEHQDLDKVIAGGMGEG